MDEYLNGEEASDAARERLTPDRRDALSTAYRTGHDLGFVATLIAQCVAIRERER